MSVVVPFAKDIAWLAFLSVVMPAIVTEIWPLLLREPRRPLIKNIINCALHSLHWGIPLLLVDWISESKGYKRRLNGRFPTLTTIAYVVQMTILPGIMMMYYFIRIWSLPKPMDEAAMNRSLTACRPPSDEICIICRGDFVEAVELPCRHVFCDGCIRHALREWGACPICRRKYA